MGTCAATTSSSAATAPEVRRSAEASLVRRYVDAVIAEGRATWDHTEAWESYRHQAFYGLLMHVIASMLVESTERGDAMFATLVSRHAQHVLDLDAFSTFRAVAGALVPKPEDERLHAGGRRAAVE